MGGADRPARLLHIFDVPEILPSGMPIAIFNQMKQQMDLGHTVLSVNYQPMSRSSQTKVDFQALAPCESRVVSSILRLIIEVRELSGTVDGIYIHGLWTRSALSALFMPEAMRQKVRHAPHGALDRAAMQFGYFKKQIAWHMAQKHALQMAGTVIATSPRELDGIKQILPHANLELVPLSLPKIDPAPIPNGARQRLLYFGRIHPIKGIRAILKAWKAVHSQLPTWDLVLMGPQEEAWLEQFEDMAKNLKLPRVAFLPAVMPDRRLEALAAASLVVAPSQTENFGLVIAEALALGRNVIASEQTGWEPRPGLVLFTDQIGLEQAILVEAQKFSQEPESHRVSV